MLAAFITDTHLGAGETGFSQQNRWLDGLGILLGRLDDFIAEHQVGLLLHGGDMTEHGSDFEIAAACAHLASFDVPSVVCLGNHDLMEAGSMKNWRAVAKRFERIQLGDVVVNGGAADVIAMNVMWQGDAGAAHFWPGNNPVATLAATQLAWLEDVLSGDVGRPAILMLHAQLAALPPELTGLPAPIHDAPAEYIKAVRSVLNRHPRVRLVLGGHCHAAWRDVGPGKNPAAILSAASFIETPHQVWLIDVRAETIEVSAHSLAAKDDPIAMNVAKAWTVGVPHHQRFSIPF